MNLRITASTLVIATLLATPALAQDAQPDSGWYSTLLGGVAFGGASDVAQNGTIVPNDTDLGKKTGWALSGAGGYDWGLFRTELEAAHRHNAADGDGSFKTNSFMANLLADVPIMDNGLTIYAGGGVGLAKTVFDAISSPNVPFAVTGDDWGGAYQLIAGLRMPFTDTISGHLDYRFFDPHNVDLVDSVGGRAQTGLYSSHTVMVGLSVLFGQKAEAAAAPPPPPPPPPAPEPQPEPEPEPAPAPVVEAPSGPFLVFFDWDSAQMTDDAKAILDQARESFRELGRARIVLQGHTDSSGPDSYNQGLSERRAKAAQDYLETLGVSGNVVSTEGFGEKGQLVPTPDGTREPQNRRVEIILEE